jgi:hypothetical protein
MQNGMILCGMFDLCRIIFGIVVDLFRPRATLDVLRQQIIVLRRGRPSRLAISGRRQGGSGFGYSYTGVTASARVSWRSSQSAKRQRQNRILGADKVGVDGRYPRLCR